MDFPLAVDDEEAVNRPDELTTDEMEIYLKELTLAGDLYWTNSTYVVFLIETNEWEDVQPYVCGVAGYFMDGDTWKLCDWKSVTGRLVGFCANDCPFWDKCRVDREGNRIT